LPELALIEGIQQVAMKRDESLSPSLFTLRSHFAVIRHNYYHVFMTAPKFLYAAQHPCFAGKWQDGRARRGIRSGQSQPLSPSSGIAVIRKMSQANPEKPPPNETFSVFLRLDS
jgi:hypothetical protein